MSGVFLRARQNFLEGKLAWSADGVAEALLLSAAPRLGVDEEMVDIPQSAIIARLTLSSRRSENGAALADNIVFRDVPEAECVGVVIAINSRLVAWVDDAPFPIQAKGTDIKIEWDARGIFSL